MKTISRYIMTLALLLTAVTGAWAKTDPNAVYWTNEIWAGWAENVTTHTVGDITITCSGNAKAYETMRSGEPLAMEAGNNDAITFTSNGKPFTSIKIQMYDSTDPGLAGWTWDNWYNVDWSGTPSTSVTLSGCDIKADEITFTFGTAEAPITVAWDASTKTGTFAMPGSDVVLTPIYSAATIYSGETETPFETLKEAFANVKNGDVIKLDWNVTLTETVETLLRGGAIKFTLDLNGYIIDGMTPEYAIRLRNGDYMTITDSSLGQTGGLKCQELVGEQGAMFIFDGGRYTMGQATADLLNAVCSKATAAILLAEGKEFVDLEGGAEANDGFMVRVGFKTFELTIGAGKFATFYDDNNIEFAEKPAEGVGLYTISSIDANRSTATVTPISGIIPAGTPMLVYNGTEQKQTAKLIVTLDNVQDAVAWADQFKGTATDHEFTADDMAAADYYALSGGKAFAPVKGAGILGANQCWLQFEKQEIPSARQFTLVFDSEATGIKTTDCTDYTDSVWYDLNGRKVAAPSKKGIYIMNGHKVVIK